MQPIPVAARLLGLQVSNPTWGHARLSLVRVVCCQRSLRRADHSARGVLSSVLYLSVIRCNSNPLHLQ